MSTDDADIWQHEAVHVSMWGGVSTGGDACRVQQGEVYGSVRVLIDVEEIFVQPALECNRGDARYGGDESDGRFRGGGMEHGRDVSICVCAREECSHLIAQHQMLIQALDGSMCTPT